jgi:GT2 family glycosyltransferase
VILNIQPLPNTEHSQVVPYRPKVAVSAEDIRNRTQSDALGTCSVVMVSYQTGPVLIDSLRAALEQEAVDAVILVDNGNSAETRRAVDTLAEADKRLRIIRGHGNVGFARGCNLGARAATGSHLLLLNPDCMLRPGVVQRGLQVLADTPSAGARTVRIENTDGTEQRGGRRNLMTPWTCLVEQFRLDRLMPNHPHFQRLNLNETEPLTEITPVQCISGAFMLMPRAMYDRVGGMDEDYFLHVEDVDLCLRIQEAGGAILYVPDAAVTHVKGTSRVFPLVVEWHKSVSVAKYFGKHFRPQYPDLALRLISMAIFLRLAVRAVPLTLNWVLERLGLRAARED